MTIRCQMSGGTTCPLREECRERCEWEAEFGPRRQFECECDRPLVVCDENGCRCFACGGSERRAA